MHTTGVLSLSVAAVLMPSVLRAQGVTDLVRLAMQNNRELASLRQRVPEARSLLRQAGARPAPVLEFSGTTGRPLRTVGEEQYTASYNYTLETGGKRSLRMETAGFEIALAQAEFDERLRQLAYEIAVLYADGTARQRKLEQLNRLVGLTNESMALMEARVREGDAAPLEIQLLRVELSRAEAERLSTAGQLDAILIELKQLAGMGPAEPLTLVSTDPSAQERAAAIVRPDIQIARLLEQQTGSETLLAAARGTPDLTLTASYSRQYARFDDQPVELRDRDDVLTFGVQIPIGTRKRNRGYVEAAGARAAGARLRREALEARAVAEQAAALRRVDAAKARLAVFDSGVLRQSEKNLGVIREAYQLGQFRLLDVLAEQRRLFETQLSYIDSQTELAKSLAELERAAGGTR